MARNIIVLEDDSFVEEEIADDYEELREFRDSRWSRDLGELDAADDLVLMSWADGYGLHRTRRKPGAA